MIESGISFTRQIITPKLFAMALNPAKFIFEALTYDDVLQFSEKLFKNLDGIRHMTKLPSAIWVVDTKKEHLAVQEAKKLGIPVIAILDTNCDPDEVDYKIPGNDDAIRSIGLLTRVITDAIVAGLAARSATVKEESKSDAPAEVAAGEPLADWEKEIAVSETMSEPTENLDGAQVPAQGTTTDVVVETPPQDSITEAVLETPTPVEGEQ